MEEKRLEEDMRLRQRRNKKSKSNNDSDDEMTNGYTKSSKRTNKMIRFRKSSGKQMANRFIFGLTFTVGVAAVAMYAINSNASQPQELLSKFYQLLTPNNI